METESSNLMYSQRKSKKLIEVEPTIFLIHKKSVCFLIEMKIFENQQITKLV